MKKINVLKKSVVGVCAATLLMGLCAAPAFAASSMDVKLDTKAIQISATLPTNGINASLDAQGAMTFPEFSVTNNSIMSVYISNVKVSGVNADIKLLDSAAYTASTTDKNAATVVLTSGGKTIDLGACKEPAGKTFAEADAISVGTGVSNTAAFTASNPAMKNLNGKIISATPLSFMTVAMTVTAS